MTTPVQDPATARRQLKVALRHERGMKNLTRDEAARRLDWSLSKLVRIESGHQGISVTDLRALLDLYGVADADKIQDYAELARWSRRQAWWAAYRDIITKQFGQYLGYEGAAAQIRVFHPYAIPGLLHTAEYAVALLSGRKSEESLRRLVDLRTERQGRLLDRPGPPRISFIFGEEALARTIGGPPVMGRQLEHLLELSGRPNVSIRVVPFSKGAHPGLVGSFILLNLRESSDDLLFLENQVDDFVGRDDEEILGQFLDYFEELEELAADNAGSQELIRRYASQLALPA